MLTTSTGMSSSPLTSWSVNPAVAGDGIGLFRDFVK